MDFVQGKFMFKNLYPPINQTYSGNKHRPEWSYSAGDEESRALVHEQRQGCPAHFPTSPHLLLVSAPHSRRE